MKKSSYSLLLLGLLSTIALIHAVAVYNYWYWKYLWLDIPMHLAGGFFVGGATLWCALVQYGERPFSRRWIPFLISIAAVLVVGTAWEIFEYIFGVAMVAHESYVSDTILDYCMDLLGSIIAAAHFLLVYGGPHMAGGGALPSGEHE